MKLDKHVTNLVQLYSHQPLDHKKNIWTDTSSVAYRSHAQVVCVAQTNLASKTLQLIHSDSLQGALSTDWHENRGTDSGVRQY